jgi:hypothetical protein
VGIINANFGPEADNIIQYGTRRREEAGIARREAGLGGKIAGSVRLIPNWAGAMTIS